MGFSRQEYWIGLPFPSPGYLSGQGIKYKSPALAGGLFTTESPGKTCAGHSYRKKILHEPDIKKYLLFI